ncbi:MAG: helix-turn-helix transcriptional regulator [Lachnospiraceae bacterium]|nr:helix-turn-helix transcriptional regulator [Lachnospiraceae bacterium]MBQ9609671.1 helix-turn-helix transcriptional regulator [Lachnospiraceae bacterium]
MSYNNFGLHLKRIRKHRNLTQLDVSKMLGISRQAYCNYEQGIRVPDPDTLASLSIILDANLFIYFMESAINTHSIRRESDIPIEEYSSLINIYSNLSLSERFHLLDNMLPNKSEKGNNNAK